MTATTLAAPAGTSSTAARRHPRTTGRRWTPSRSSIRQWFARSQLGPVDNYVTR